MLGLPGLAFGVVTIPADLTFTIYLHLRMIAVIALLHGWDVRLDRLKTRALLSMLGAGAVEAVRAAGVQVGAKLAGSVPKRIPGRVLIQINKVVGFRLVTKAGTQGVVNLIEFAPIVGGLNATATRGIGYTAHGFLKAELDRTCAASLSVTARAGPATPAPRQPGPRARVGRACRATAVCSRWRADRPWPCAEHPGA